MAPCDVTVAAAAAALAFFFDVFFVACFRLTHLITCANNTFTGRARDDIETLAALVLLGKNNERQPTNKRKMEKKKKKKQMCGFMAEM